MDQSTAPQQASFDFSTPTCAIPDCGKCVIARGFCKSHWRLWKLYGDPNVVLKKGGKQVGALPDRIWARVTKDGPVKRPELGQCWEWQGARTDHKGKIGYGAIKVDGVQQEVHRLVYEMSYGPLPADKPYACHKCDNPPCCRPDHLFAGNPFDNMQDMAAKGRRVVGIAPPERRPSGDNHHARLHPERLARGDRHASRTHPERLRRGASHPNTELTEDQVQAIRAEHVPRIVSYTMLAARYNTTKSAVAQIIAGKSWKHILP